MSSRIIAPAARAAGVPWATAHDLRHTFVTRCIASGVNPKQIQVIVGHTSIGLTMDTYGHLFDEHLPDALPEIEPDEPVTLDVEAVAVV